MSNKSNAARVLPATIQCKGRFALSAQVTPGMGANLISLRVDGNELIHWDAKGFLAGKSFTGAFNMFPTPCRLANCSYVFEGRKILQRKNGADVFVHGLVRDEDFTFVKKAKQIVSTIKIAPGHPVYEGFPFHCIFRVTHALDSTGLKISFALKNCDRRNIPFGYGVHPFWRIHGERKDLSVRVPCDSILELKDLVPTGGHSPVKGTPLDLRKERDIDGLFIDNAFWKRKPGTSADVIFRALGLKMTISASANFPHMIVYAPEGQPFICVENLTTCPNAPNLVTAGKGKVANMLIARPGQTVQGWIKYSLKKI